MDADDAVMMMDDCADDVGGASSDLLVWLHRSFVL